MMERLGRSDEGGGRGCEREPGDKAGLRRPARASTPNCWCMTQVPKLFPYGKGYGQGAAMKPVGQLAARSPGLRLALALQIKRRCSADQILQARLINLVALMEIDGAPGVAFKAGVEQA